MDSIKKEQRNKYHREYYKANKLKIRQTKLAAERKKLLNQSESCKTHIPLTSS